MGIGKLYHTSLWAASGCGDFWNSKGGCIYTIFTPTYYFRSSHRSPLEYTRKRTPGVVEISKSISGDVDVTDLKNG